MNTAWHLSVDFGTSNSAAAHTGPLSGNVEALPLSHRSNLIPSAVYVQEDGKIYTGDTALSMGRRDASRLVPTPKRYIGHDYVQVAGKDVPLNTLIGAIFHGVVGQGRNQHAGADPTSVTITHPESWSVHNINTLLSAAVSAGIAKETIRTISEPRAAAVHYAAQQHIPAGSHVAVFDFGGGTLDIAVLRAEENGDFTVVAAKGDNTLGGRTIDNLLYRWVLDQVEKDSPDLADQLKHAQISVMHSLDQSIREAKEILSDTSSATITVSTPQGEYDFLITRDEFNQIIHNAVQRAVELTQSALRQAGVNEQTPIYMTGGSSRIPYVQDRLAGVGSVMTLDDPKTVVARGALTASLHGFTEGSEQITAPQPQQPGNPFGAGPGTAGAKRAKETVAPSAQTPPASHARPKTETNPKRKKTLLAVSAVIAVIVLIFGFQLYSSYSTVTDVNTTAADQTAPIQERYSTVDKFLPEQTINVLQKCYGEADEFSDDVTVPVYKCSTSSNMEGAPEVGGSTPSTIYWVPGKDAKQAYEDVESGKSMGSTDVASKDRLQKSSRKKPEVGYVLSEYGSGFGYAYYPKQKFMLYYKTYSDSTPEQITEMAKYLGWMK